MSDDISFAISRFKHLENLIKLGILESDEAKTAAELAKLAGLSADQLSNFHYLRRERNKITHEASSNHLTDKERFEAAYLILKRSLTKKIKVRIKKLEKRVRALADLIDEPMVKPCAQAETAVKSQGLASAHQAQPTLGQVESGYTSGSARVGIPGTPQRRGLDAWDVSGAHSSRSATREVSSTAPYVESPELSPDAYYFKILKRSVQSTMKISQHSEELVFKKIESFYESKIPSDYDLEEITCYLIGCYYWIDQLSVEVRILSSPIRHQQHDYLGHVVSYVSHRAQRSLTIDEGVATWVYLLARCAELSGSTQQIAPLGSELIRQLRAALSRAGQVDLAAHLASLRDPYS